MDSQASFIFFFEKYSKIYIFSQIYNFFLQECLKMSERKKSQIFQMNSEVFYKKCLFFLDSNPRNGDPRTSFIRKFFFLKNSQKNIPKFIIFFSNLYFILILFSPNPYTKQQITV